MHSPKTINQIKSYLTHELAMVYGIFFIKIKFKFKKK